MTGSREVAISLKKKMTKEPPSTILEPETPRNQGNMYKGPKIGLSPVSLGGQEDGGGSIR